MIKKFTYLNKDKISQLPKKSGVYAFKADKEILYIGKAANVRERVKNHFQQPTYRDNLFINQVKKIGYLKTDSEIEALILEANLIKKYQPKYNVIWRDDKNYFYVGETKEDFPRIFVTHQTKLKPETYNLKPNYVGPFVDGKALKETLKILRRVFPYRSCRVIPKRACLWYHLERCPAPCLLKSTFAKEIGLEEKIKKQCQMNARNILGILRGKKILVLKKLKKEMKEMVKFEDFEGAAKIRNQIAALEKVLANARVFEEFQFIQKVNWSQTQKSLCQIFKTRKKISRIEAYDISNIQGEAATGSMVTFINGRPDKDFYRRFKIRITGKPDDIAMLKEVLSRRLNHPEWPYPDLILIDGGKPQLNAARQCLIWKIKQPIKVGALAKKENKLYVEGQKEPLLLKKLPREIFNLILQLRDEAHRFARKYHLKLREIDLHLER